MPRVKLRRWTGPVVALWTAALLSGCSASPATTGTTSPSPTAPPATSSTVASRAAVSPVAPVTRTKNWFDLDAGDCLAEPPPVDPNVIAVTLVDCATAHQAEVYLRRPMAVNTALADVADRDCDQGFGDYTGQPAGTGRFAVTYLIDSNQNRTASNPNPSTVICLLVPTDGQDLTGSARR